MNIRTLATLLAGLLPSASFPDNSAPDYPDCRLIHNYFGVDLSLVWNLTERELRTLKNAVGALLLEGGDETAGP